MVQSIIESNLDIHVLRDPTRGGLGTTLNEIATQSNVGIDIYENYLPVQDSVQGICELLGFDPLYIANEGKLIAFVPEKDSREILEIIQKNEFGKMLLSLGR